MRHTLYALLIICVFAASTTGCKNNSEDKKIDPSAIKGSSADQVHNDTLKGFMLAGVYFVHGYGGPEAFYDKIKKTINLDNSKAPFLTLLDSAYSKTLIFPFAQSPSEKVDSRNTLSSWFQINNQNDFYLFLNNLKDSGFQSHYELCRKALDENGGVQANVGAIDLAKYHLPKGSELLLQFVKDNYNKFSTAGIKAWNIGLYVYVVTLGYGAEYANAHTGKSLILDQLKEAEKYYSDWKTYFSDFMLGREFSGVAKSENAAYRKTIEGMLTGHYSMYTHLPL